MGDQYVWTFDHRLPTPPVGCWSHSGDLTISAKCALVLIASPEALLLIMDHGRPKYTSGKEIAIIL